MTNAQIPADDPLASFDSVPAVSFHAPNGGHAVGEKVALKLTDWPKLLDQKDDDGNVETWDNGDPKKVLVIAVEDGGEKRSLWAKKTGRKAEKSLFQQITKAQKQLREKLNDPTRRLQPGDTLWVCYTGDDRSVPPKKGNYPKMFAAVIEPGAGVAPASDPFAEDAAPPKDTSPFGADTAAPAAASSAPNVSGDPFGDAPIGEDEPPF